MNHILNRLEGFYGKVSSSETLMQEHYNDSQKEDESIVAYEGQGFFNLEF